GPGHRRGDARDDQCRWRLSGDGSHARHVQEEERNGQQQEGRRGRLMNPATVQILINAAYIVASILFILGLKMLGRQGTARTGNLLSSVGMLLAIVVTLLDRNVIDFTWITIGLVLGTAIGVACARLVKMTAMPEMVALLNGFGGLASLIVGAAE